MKPLTTAIIAAFLCGAVAAGEETSTKYELSGVDHMDAFVGSDAAREHLARTGFVITDQHFRQIFEAYISSPLPKFVTTDSAWHTYHVLLEEGVRQLEAHQSSNLRRFSRRLVQVAMAKSNGEQGPYWDLARFAGVGLALQDLDALQSVDKELKAQTESVLQELRGGSGPREILFFGLPFMPERLEAHSFYTGSPDLAAYFTARQFYALCDFRAKSKEETALALRLALLIERDAELGDLYSKLTQPYERLLGPPEDGDVASYAAIAGEVYGDDPREAELPGKLGEFRERLSELPLPSINDQYLLPDKYENFREETRGFRLLPRRRIPSAVLFHNTVDPIIKGRMFPSGLDFCAVGPLASEAGRRALRASAPDEKTYEAILNAEAAPPPDSLHGEALKLLALLQEPLPEVAPAPLRTSAWQDKQLWTQLGAWAEQRHTWALHTKLTVHYAGMTMEDPGMVSPYPEFFKGLGQLSRATARELSAFEAEEAIDAQALGKQLLELVDLLDAARRAEAEPSEEDIEKMMMFSAFLEALFAGEEPESEADIRRELDSLKQLGQKSAKGAELTEEELEVLKKLKDPSEDVSTLLRDFSTLCDSLAAIARKELAGKPLNAEDAELIRNYGKTLARFHFYGGNSWLEPRDDFSLVTPIFVSLWHKQTLYAGLARPEALYLIVESGDRAILHRGAVLSYREFRRPLNSPLDDEAWKAEVMRGSIPQPPSFTDSFRKTVTEDEVAEIIRSGGIYGAVDGVPGRNITQIIVEQLLAGTHPHADWLRERLCNRAGKQDVGDLIRVLKSTPPEHVGQIAICIADLPWVDHRGELHGLLRRLQAPCADSAAYILSKQPENIDAGMLAAEFDTQPIRTKRLYVFLFGHVASPGGKPASIVLDALSAEDPGLRYEAAKAVARAGLDTAAHLDALASQLKDPNEYVCAAAASALRDLHARDAAPAMLARLEKGVRPRNVTSSASHRQHEAVFEGTSYSGFAAIMVLAERWPPFMIGSGPDSLGEELIKGLGEFAYVPAADELEGLLRGNYGMEALEALNSMDPDGHLDRMLELATDREAVPFVRERVLELIAASEDTPDVALRLVPALDDTAGVGLSIDGEEWRICDYAAKAIATILKWPNNITDDSGRRAKEALIEKIRKWAATQE